MSAGKEANNAFLGNPIFRSLGLIVDRITDNQSSRHLDEKGGRWGAMDRTRGEKKDTFKNIPKIKVNFSLLISILCLLILHA